MGIFTFKHYDDIQYETRFFFTDIDFFLKNVTFALTPEEWKTTAPYKDTSHNLERIFVSLLEDVVDEIYFYDSTIKQFFPNSKIDTQSIVPSVSIVYNTSDPNRPIIFLSNSGEEKIIYDITVTTELEKYTNWNSSKDNFNYAVNPGKQIKHFISLGEMDTIVDVVAETNSCYIKKIFVLNKKNIIEYSDKANYYKLV
jgi:hypothetical protein